MPPFDSLNLAVDGLDSATARQENLARALSAFSAPEHCGMTQVHGSDVVHVRTGGQVEAVDALVTDRPGLCLVVRVADCVPILLADADAAVIGAVHAGRAGLLAGVVENALDAMRSLGAAQITAWMGPSVCAGCYEVGHDVQAEVASRYPATRAHTTWGTPSLDVAAGVRSVLVQEEVELVAEVDRCTKQDDDLFSYRRDGAHAGRLAGLIMIRPDGEDADA